MPSDGRKRVVLWIWSAKFFCSNGGMGDEILQEGLCDTHTTMHMSSVSCVTSKPDRLEQPSQKDLTILWRGLLPRSRDVSLHHHRRDLKPVTFWRRRRSTSRLNRCKIWARASGPRRRPHHCKRAAPTTRTTTQCLSRDVARHKTRSAISSSREAAPRQELTYRHRNQDLSLLSPSTSLYAFLAPDVRRLEVAC